MRITQAPRCSRNSGPHGWLVLLAISILAVLPTAAAERPWCSALVASALEGEVASEDEDNAREGEKPGFVSLDLERAEYRVDVLGNLAVGTLELQFHNDTNRDVQAQFVSQSPPPSLTVDALELSVAGEVADELEEIEAADTRNSSQARRGRATPKKRTVGFKSNELTVPVGETVVAEIRFRRPLFFGEGLFELTLPALRGNCAGLPGPFEGADDGQLPAPLNVTVKLHGDRPLPTVESDSHAILVDFEGDYTIAELVVPDELGEHPFHLSYALGEQAEPSLAAFAGPEIDGVRDVLMVLAPAQETAPETVRPKEALFVFDTSGSMRGEKIAEARGAIYACLEKLGADDMFNIAEFDGNFTLAFEDLEDATEQTLATARGWLQAQKAGGSTTLLPALDAIMEQPQDPGRHRIVIVLTDGQLGDTPRVEKFLADRLGEARFFVVGIGEDVVQATILRLAELGRGTAAFANDAQQLSAAVEQLFAGISSAVAWDVRVQWGGAEVVEMTPRRMPDLYAGRPVTVRARVRGELPPDLEVTAATMDGDRVFRVALPAGGAREFEALEQPARAEKKASERGRTVPRKRSARP